MSVGECSCRKFSQSTSAISQLITFFPHHLYIFPGGAFPLLLTGQDGRVVGDGQLCAGLLLFKILPRVMTTPKIVILMSNRNLLLHITH